MGIEYLSRESFSSDSNIPEVLSDISGAVKRADQVIHGLLDFSAPKKLEMKEIDLNAIIEQSLVLVRGEMHGEGFEIVKNLSPDLPLVKLDTIKIGQVFINIFTNAIHSMGDGGTLSVRTFARQLAGVGPNVGDNRRNHFAWARWWWPPKSTTQAREFRRTNCGRCSSRSSPPSRPARERGSV